MIHSYLILLAAAAFSMAAMSQKLSLNSNNSQFVFQGSQTSDTESLQVSSDAGLASSENDLQEPLIAIDSATHSQAVGDALLLGILLMLAAYNFYIFALRPSRQESLWYGVLIGSFAVKVIYSGKGQLILFLASMLPNLDHNLVYWLIAFVSGVSLVMLLNVADIETKTIGKTIVAIGLPALGLAKLSINTMFHHMNSVWFTMSNFYLVGYLIFLFILWIKYNNWQQNVSKFWWIGFFLLIASFSQNILSQLQLINHDHSLFYGLTGMVIVQTLTIARRVEFRADSHHQMNTCCESFVKKSFLIEQKEQELASALRSLPAGIIKINGDRSLNTRLWQSHSCLIPNISFNADFETLIQNIVKPDSRQLVKDIIDQSLNNFDYIFQMNCHHLPKYATTKHKGNTRRIKISWTTMCNSNGIVSSVLLAISSCQLNQQPAIKYSACENR